MATANEKATPFFVYLGRVFFALAFLALLGAWFTQLTGGTLLGMTQQHLFKDATVLSLFGIGILWMPCGIREIFDPGLN